MSMISDYELADDGKWYEHAVIGEPKKWYVCFDDEDPPQLVIRKMRVGQGDRMELYMEVEALIQQFKLPFEIVSRNSDHDCMFPDVTGRWNGKMLKATSYVVRLTGTIPSALIICFKDVFDRKPNGDGVFYGTV
jgi:hypothetical protein